MLCGSVFLCVCFTLNYEICGAWDHLGFVHPHICSSRPTVWHICLMSICWIKLQMTIRQIDEIRVHCLSYKGILAAKCNLFLFFFNFYCYSITVVCLFSPCNLFHCKRVWFQVQAKKATTWFAQHNLKSIRSLSITLLSPHHSFAMKQVAWGEKAYNCNWITIKVKKKETSCI